MICFIAWIVQMGRMEEVHDGDPFCSVRIRFTSALSSPIYLQSRVHACHTLSFPQIRRHDPLLPLTFLVQQSHSHACATTPQPRMCNNPTATHVQQTRQKTTTFRPFPAGPSFPRGSSSVRAFRPWRRPSCRDRAAEPPAGPAGSWGSSRSHPPSTRHRQPRRRR